MTKGEATRQFIIEKAAPIFNTKGIAATSMSDIMEATKLAKGSLYVHFENKDVLANAAVDYNIKLLGERTNALLNKHKSPYNKLLAYIDSFKTPTNLLIEGGCPIMNFGMEADDTDPVIKNKAYQGVILSQQMIAGMIEDGIKEKIFSPRWDYKEFSTIAFAMIEGGIMMCRVAGNNDIMKVINKHLKKIIQDNIL